MIKIPDLLFVEPRLALQRKALEDVLGMAALGKEIGTEFHDALAASDLAGRGWQPDLFAEDLFLDRLVRDEFNLELDGIPYPVNHRFLERVLRHVPSDLETVEFRQAIVRELDDDPSVLERVQKLYAAVFGLLSLHKAPGYQTNVDVAAFHLDILRQSRLVIDFMSREFESSRSGLRRLHEAGRAIQETKEYATLASLLEFEQGLAQLTLDVTIGGDGAIRKLSVKSLEELTKNRFYKSPFKRFTDRWRLAFNGYSMSQRELMNRLINEIYRELSPVLIQIVQLVGHLEFYLTARTFRERAVARGLEVCLPEVRLEAGERALRIERLFNPLLLDQDPTPVPCDLETDGLEPITIVTGPNSGGKTRLLQAIALCQLLAQSGIYAPCKSARLRCQNGLFVSLIEREAADQMEGRLGRELLRIRTLFEQMEKGSLVVLDELCSGTNPSEGIEVFSLVLKLLERVEPVAYVTTHFLDFARNLADSSQIPTLEFLQVAMDDDKTSTYQFRRGVAETSLATLTAQRLGVTFESLSATLGDTAEPTKPN